MDKFLHGWTLAQKIQGGFFILLVAFLGFGVFANYTGAQLNHATRSLYRWTAAYDLASSIADTANRARRDSVLAALMNLMGSKTDFDQYNQIYQDSSAKVDQMFTQYDTLLQEADYDSEADRQAMKERVQGDIQLWQAYKNARQRVFAAMQQNGEEVDRNTIITAMNGEARTTFANFINTMQDDEANLMQRAQNNSENAEELFHRGVRSTLMVAGFIFLVTLFCAWYLYHALKINTTRMLASMEQVAEGDFRLTLDTSAGDEFAKMGDAFNRMLEKVRAMIKRIQNATNTVNESSTALSRTSEQSATATQNIAQSVTKVATATHKQMDAIADTKHSVERFENGVEKTNGVVAKVVEKINATTRRATEGNRLVHETVGHMNAIADTVHNSSNVVAKLGERSQEIGTIVEAISGISSQTNLLALNAAIEAARAGEHGRGFAVVAEEVRKLAEESKKASEKITVLITAIQKETEEAVNAMSMGREQAEKGRENVAATGEHFTEIQTMIQNVHDDAGTMEETMRELTASAQRISAATERIHETSTKVTTEAENISASIEEQSAGMQEVAASSRSLSEMADTLNQAVAKFRTT